MAKRKTATPKAATYKLAHQPGCSESRHGIGVTDCEGSQRRVFAMCEECGARAEWVVDCG